MRAGPAERQWRMPLTRDSTVSHGHIYKINTMYVCRICQFSYFYHSK